MIPTYGNRGNLPPGIHELFPADAPADPNGTRFLAYFQRERETGEPKGIVKIDLERLT